MLLSRGKLQVFAKRWNKQGKGVVLPLPKKSKNEQQVTKPVFRRKAPHPLPSKVSTSNPWASTVFKKARMLSVNSNSAFHLDAALHLFIEQPSLVMWDSHSLAVQLEQLMAALDLPAHDLLHVVARQPLILSAMPYRLQKELQVIASHLGATKSQVLEAAVKQPAIMKVDPAAALAVCQTMANILEQPVSAVVSAVMLEPDLLRVQPSSLPLRVATLAQVLQLSLEEAAAEVLASPQLLLPSTSAVLANFQRLADLKLVNAQTLLAMCKACPQLLVTPAEHIRQSAAALGELLGCPQVPLRAAEETAADATEFQASCTCSSSESAIISQDGSPTGSSAASSSSSSSGSLTASTTSDELHVASDSGSTPASSLSSHSSDCTQPTVAASAVRVGAGATAAPTAQATAISADASMSDATPSVSSSSAWASDSSLAQGTTPPSRSDRTSEATSSTAAPCSSPHSHRRPRQPTLQSHMAAAPHILLCSPAVLRERMHCLRRIMDSRTPAATARLAASDVRYLSLDTAHIDNALLDLEFQLSLPRSAAVALAHQPRVFFDLRPVDVSAVMRVLQGWLTPDAGELHALMVACPQLFAREAEEVASAVSALRAAASSGGRPEAEVEAVRILCTGMPELLLHGPGSVLLLQAVKDALHCPAGEVVQLVGKVARVAPGALDSGEAVEAVVRTLLAVALLGGVLALPVTGVLEVVMAMVPAVLRPGQVATVQGSVKALAAVCAQQEPWRLELQAASASRLASVLLSPADRIRRLGYLVHLNAASLLPCHQVVMTAEADFLRSFPGFQHWQEPPPRG